MTLSKRNTEIVFYATQVIVWTLCGVIFLGYVIGSDTLIRGGFESLPIMRKTTLTEAGLACIVLVLFFHKKEDWRYNMSFVAQAGAFLSLSLFFTNAQDGNTYGIETILFGSKNVDPSQATQLAFALFFTSALFATKKLHHFVTEKAPNIIIIASAFIAMLGYVTGYERLFYQLIGSSYGMSVFTAVVLFLVAFCFMVLAGRKQDEHV